MHLTVLHICLYFVLIRLIRDENMNYINFMFILQEDCTGKKSLDWMKTECGKKTQTHYVLL